MGRDVWLIDQPLTLMAKINWPTKQANGLFAWNLWPNSNAKNKSRELKQRIVHTRPRLDARPKLDARPRLETVQDLPSAP